ncbi:Trehalose-phosphatase [Phytophthora cinnamomi]|uniref:Trehalose-phosphatase n=1 Tax=Phytophthora cinnamomi TaxID=4785 RepID=UPI003559E76A|nr:Trehalose-phosphatase [Phytophthora cinnamomi]
MQDKTELGVDHGSGLVNFGRCSGPPNQKRLPAFPPIADATVFILADDSETNPISAEARAHVRKALLPAKLLLFRPRRASLPLAASMATTAAEPEPLAVAASGSQERPRRLSVTNANALANFGELQAHFRDHRLVVFLDYDGTLTPIVNDPALALLSPAMKDTLEKLRQKFITGVITGRSLHKIQKFVSIPQLYYAGSHGFDIEGPDGTSIKNQVAAQFLTDLHDVRDELGGQIESIAGAEVEDNIFSVSLHYRNVDPGLRPQISSLARTVRDQHPRIRMNEGKMVYEFKPKIDWNKGKALLWLLQALGLDEHDDVYTIYIGDDTTDEDAFQLFQTHYNRKGVGIIVTEESKSTDASFTLRDTGEVCEFLNRLIACGDRERSAPSSPQPTDPPPTQAQ